MASLILCPEGLIASLEGTQSLELGLLDWLDEAVHRVTQTGQGLSIYSYACSELLRLFYGPCQQKWKQTCFVSRMAVEQDEQNKLYLLLPETDYVYAVLLDEKCATQPEFWKRDDRSDLESMRAYFREVLSLRELYLAKAKVADWASCEKAGGRGIEVSHLGYRSQVGTEQSPKLEKRLFKRVLYQLLSEESGKAFPWGSLTGIRPQQLATEAIDAGWDEEAVKRQLVEDYALNLNKAELAFNIARAEKALADQVPSDQLAVYIGIPFCPTRCSYCSFSTEEAVTATEALREAYVEALCASIRAGLEKNCTPISLVYVGGGTPTSLSPAQLDRVLATLAPYLNSAHLKEYCLEAGRSDSIQEGHLDLIPRYGITRFCLNPQTMNSETLRHLNRPENVEEIERLFWLLRARYPYLQVNMDLIAGLAQEGLSDFEYSLAQLLRLGPDQITVHALASKRGARLEGKGTGDYGLGDKRQRLLQEDVQTLQNRLRKPDSVTEEMLDVAALALAQAGYQPYYLYRQKDGLGGLENVGYAKGQSGCLYNVAMMGDVCSIMAFGLGAMNKYVEGTRTERLRNLRSLEQYLKRQPEESEQQRQFFAQKGRLT